MEDVLHQARLVIDSASPAYLKPLHDCLRRNDNAGTQSWFHLDPDAVAPLAIAVVEQVELGLPYSMEVLGILASIEQLRDALLTQAPDILDNVLSLIAKSATNKENAIQACVSLLAFPLPRDIALPASAHQFLSSLFESLMLCPSIETAEPVFRVLDGAGATLLHQIPRPRLIEFYEHVRGIMSKIKEGSAGLLNMFCIAIMAKIYFLYNESQEDSTCKDMSSGASRVLSTCRDDADYRRLAKFFSGCENAALNTVLLVAMQVIYSCNPDSRIPVMERLKHLHLARRITSCIDHETINLQFKNKPQIMGKLLDRLSLPSLDAAARIQATAFVCHIASVRELSSPKLDSSCEKSISVYVDGPGDSVPDRLIFECIRVVIAYSNPSFSEETWYQLLKHIFDRLGELVRESTAGVHYMKVLIEELNTVQTRCSCLRKAVAQIISSNHHHVFLLDSCPDFVTKDSPSKSHSMRNELKLCAISFLLGTALSFESTGQSFPKDVALKLLQEQKDLSWSFRTDPPRIAAKRHKIAAIPNSQTGRDIQARKWQDLLSAELDKHALEARQTMLHHFSRACHDLEERCMDVERPLREEEKRHQETKHALEITQAKLTQLEQTSRSRQECIEQLRMETEQAAVDLNIAYTELEEQCLKTREVEAKLSEVQEKAACEARDIRETCQEKSMELQTRFARSVEKVDDQRVELEARSSRIEDLQRMVEKTQNSLAEHQDRLGALEDCKQRLTLEKAGLQSDVENLHAVNAEHERKLEKQIQASAQDLKQLEKFHNEQLQHHEQEASEHKRQIQTTIQALEEQLEEQRSLSAADMAAKDKLLQDWERKFKSQASDLRLKTAEAEKLRCALASIRTVSANVGTLERASQIEEGQSQTEETQSQATDDLDRFTEEVPGPKKAANIFLGSSSRRIGPTPKRQRPQQSLQSSPPQSKPAQIHASESPYSQQQVCREPLRERTSNVFDHSRQPPRQQTAVMAASPPKFAKDRVRKSISVPNAAALLPAPKVHVHSPAKENLLINIDDLGFSTMEPQDSEESTRRLVFGEE